MNSILASVGFACGGEPGSRLAKRLGLAGSGDTLLRLIRRSADASSQTPAKPRVLGVDDWAFRKGRRYGTTAMPLGMDANEQYQGATLNLGRGDVVVLFTDGIIEAMPDNQSLYGIERLMGQVERHADDSADQLVKTIRADLYGHLAGKPMVDDLTLMVLKR